MVGYPGAGKTTVAQIISRLTGAKHVWASKVRRDRFDEKNYQPGNSDRLYQDLNAEVESQLKASDSVVYDTNFRFRSDRDNMQLMAKRAGANLVLVWVQTPEEIARRRAVEESDDKPTRIWGNMSSQRFDELVTDFDDPTDDEKPIIIEGQGVTDEMVANALGLG